MALMGMLTSDEVEFVSILDPSRKVNWVPVDPAVPNGDKRQEVVIEENATKFFLKPLDVFVMGWVYDNTVRTSRDATTATVQTRINETNLAVVKYGLSRVENFHIDRAGNQLVIKPIKAVFNGREYSAVSDDALNHFGVSLISELADEIKRISNVTGADAKKSEGVSSPSA